MGSIADNARSRTLATRFCFPVRALDFVLVPVFFGVYTFNLRQRLSNTAQNDPRTRDPRSEFAGVRIRYGR
ncbi:unnamed protein product [Callosobruchus maculatus]|uniref:Uncharacterized protein n=1 Tax=Callosobruchus maculatus TaxID=64391 RepID=A0A653DUZ7_CALMS|nr:unnamed protein product [Callosobruchus maculatus]